ncbi:hypothetical protein CELL_00080 [Cellulomonas sp. T2.31MG-18]|uniref:hypothetical protein n=1 Tax=Cellulomonas sp. T2.31MG-18 TaxID=3157619 RepID=UPI0035F01334
MSIDELDVWAQPPGRRRMRRRGTRHGVAAAAGVIAVALAVWTLVGIQVDGPLSWQLAGGATACSPDPLDAPGDVTWTFGIGAELPFRIQDVRLIGAHNVALVGAYIAVIDPGPDGVYQVPAVAAGWPSLAGGMSPASLVDAAGATVTGPAPHALVLRLRVEDPAMEASFKDVGIIYRSGPVRHEKRLEYMQRLVAGGSCT